LKQLLQRRPLGVPLHQTATTLVFGFLAGSVLLDLMAWAGVARDTTGTNAGAYGLLFAALIVAVVATLAALAETLDLEDAELRRYSWRYAGLLLVVIVLVIADLFLRQATLQDQVVPPVPLFLSLACLLGAAFAAWFGGFIASREIEEEFEQELEEPEPIRRRRRR
jgi:uncharacterized membrane protein